MKYIRFRTTVSAVLFLIYLSLTACTADDRNLRTESVQTADYRYIASHIDSSRIREISIFSSLGLAPTHIGALFMAESCVYAIIGGMAGYLIGNLSGS